MSTRTAGMIGINILSKGDHHHLRAPLVELLIIACAVLSFYSIAASFELSEKVTGFTRRYEHWQLDELPLTLLLLSASLCWFAFRRMSEAHLELIRRIQAQDRISELLNHNRDLSQRLMVIQENERRALARELHDEFGQNCTAIRAEASYILHAPVSDNVRISAQRITQSAESLSAMVRSLLKRLRPPALDSLGLESALQELCESWEEQTGVACCLLSRNIPSRLSDSTAITVYRLVQEALTNVTRHAEASQVKITLHQLDTGKILSLTIQDNGKGMPKLDRPHSGFGIIGMRERVAALRGDLHISSGIDDGLHIAVELPLESAAL